MWWQQLWSHYLGQQQQANPGVGVAIAAVAAPAVHTAMVGAAFTVTCAAVLRQTAGV
jgi:hypothetical protein